VELGDGELDQAIDELCAVRRGRGVRATIEEDDHGVAMREPELEQGLAVIFAASAASTGPRSNQLHQRNEHRSSTGLSWGTSH
jgi:hypothetical protein